MILQSLMHCSLFGLLGILLVTFGFKLFDLILTKVDLEKEVEKGNMAAAIVSAAAILAITFIVVTAIH